MWTKHSERGENMINTTLCYIEKDGKYLMLLRNKKKNDLNEGKWIGIGGKFEPGESADDCLCREVFEETGLVLTEFRLHGIIKFISDTWEDEDMYLYTADGFTGQLTDCCDEGELRWIDKDKILELDLWEGDKYFLKELMKGTDEINMTLRYQGDILVSAEI